MDGAVAIHDNFDPFTDEVFDDGKDDDNYFINLYRNGELYKDAEFGKIVLKPWLLFTDKQHVRDVVRDYCIQSGFSVIVERATNSRYTVKCSAMGCEWRLHSSQLPDGITWAIKSIKNSEHTCSGLDVNNPMVNCAWATRVLMEDVRANNDISAKSLNAILFQRYGVQMAQSTLYRVRTHALNEIHGSHDESYALLPKYCEMIKSTNQGSDVHCAWVELAEQPEKPLVFKSIFVAFKGVTDGLKGCRGLIGVDGAHLKGNHGGVLLSAVALDGNNELFPFAWAILTAEDSDSWMFFVWHLKNLLQGLGRGDSWCIISDRQKGIDVALTECWSEVDRRYCCKHLCANWKKSFPGPLLFSLFWLTVGANSEFTFRKAMEKMQKVNPPGRIWFSKLGEQKRWTKHKFNPELKCDVNKSNFVESFNATLGIDRCRPVLTLLEGIRRNTMVRIATRRQVCETWERQDIFPNIVRRIQQLCQESRTCIPYMCGEGEYELTGIPCKHGIRAIIHARLDPHSFVSEWYSVSKYREAYSSGIRSIPDVEQWPDINMPAIKPPTMKRAIGRPSRERKRVDDEDRRAKGLRQSDAIRLRIRFGLHDIGLQQALVSQMLQSPLETITVVGVMAHLLMEVAESILVPRLNGTLHRIRLLNSQPVLHLSKDGVTVFIDFIL
ncbi:uncharacterized protein LOC110724045 [Chenopodium quinoa]|uniref:uncharacterized protein LOC110724045 n=1 Tax=Chenopodium quinoa TaxID=63459 RepID=UPI000B78D62B|nr:uncharacterized protein LOC110724045 [Chenopodium quinoa]